MASSMSHGSMRGGATPKGRNRSAKSRSTSRPNTGGGFNNSAQRNKKPINEISRPQGFKTHMQLRNVVNIHTHTAPENTNASELNTNLNNKLNTLPEINDCVTEEILEDGMHLNKRNGSL